jgi:hypothetical protein
MSVSITVKGPNTTRQYRSISHATRSLSGTGHTNGALRKRISNHVRNGGGYIGSNYVSLTK